MSSSASDRQPIGQLHASMYATGRSSLPHMNEWMIEWMITCFSSLAGPGRSFRSTLQCSYSVERVRANTAPTPPQTQDLSDLYLCSKKLPINLWQLLLYSNLFIQLNTMKGRFTARLWRKIQHKPIEKVQPQTLDRYNEEFTCTFDAGNYSVLKIGPLLATLISGLLEAGEEYWMSKAGLGNSPAMNWI